MTNVEVLARTSPVIVCGNPRSGTRMHANVLSTHPDIVITDEFHDVAQLRAFLSTFRRNRLLKKFQRDVALERQAWLIKQIWLTSSVEKIATRGFTARIIGNKTPQIERQYKVLENLFCACPPMYVYCLRSASKVLRSIKNLTNLRWNRDSVEVNLGRYLKSVRCMEEMRSAFPDRIYVSVIDHLGRTTSNSEFFVGLFRFLDIEMTDDVRDQVDAMRSQNTMSDVRRVTRQSQPVTELSDEELKYISDSEEYRKIADKYSLETA